MGSDRGVRVGGVIAHDDHTSAPHEFDLSCQKRAGIDDMMNDEPRDGAIERAELIEDAVIDGALHEGGSLSMRGAADSSPFDHLGGEIHADHVQSGVEEPAADQPGAAARVEHPAAGREVSEPYQSRDGGGITLDRGSLNFAAWASNP